MQHKLSDGMYIMTDTEGNIYLDSIESTAKKCWDKFVYPALNKPAYEKAGWMPVRYKLTRVNQ